MLDVFVTLGSGRTGERHDPSSPRRRPRLGLAGATSCSACTGVQVTHPGHLHQNVHWPGTAPGLNGRHSGRDPVNPGNANQGNDDPGSSFGHSRNQLVNGDGGGREVVFDKHDRTAARGASWTGAGGTVAGPAQTMLQPPMPSTAGPRRHHRLVLVGDGRP